MTIIRVTLQRKLGSVGGDRKPDVAMRKNKRLAITTMRGDKRRRLFRGQWLSTSDHAPMLLVGVADEGTRTMERNCTGDGKPLR